MAGTAPGARTEELFHRYGRRIYGFCLARLGDRQDAEDALQSTFLNAFRGLERGVLPVCEEAWLFKIAENVCLTRRRSAFRRRRVETPVAIDDTLAAPERESDRIVDLAEAVQGLPARQRRALLLREWQGLGYAEIASELGLSLAAVETLLHRARRSVRAAA
ncbi:MAG TPA: sigma-70 family RNA polymerase sigma factor [Gaiellaceae bacterium]|nr:sigma-70 family RNA polymerase sigma factor [Gaiellaceae bacterium]